MARPIVLISYSQDSDEHKERVLGLSERLRADGIETRLDQYVGGTPDEGWPRWMLNQLDEASHVLVVCTETYYRRFRGQEEPGKGKGVDWEGAIITQALYDARSKTRKFVPVLFDHSGETFIPQPLRGQTFYPTVSEGAYKDLYDFLLDQAGVEPGPMGKAKTRARRKGTPLTFPSSSPPETGLTPCIPPSRLPPGTDHLFGREEELADLEKAWQDPKVHVLTLVAWGGVGKSALVARWRAELAGGDFDGASYFDWSFHSQGPREQGTASGEFFVAAALKHFGDEEMATSPATPWEKGARLATLLAERRTLLILDGLEPLQFHPGPLAGQLKDPALKSLLKGLAARNPGLCVVTSRFTVEDLASFRESTAPERRLGHLSTQAGVALLRSLGVHGVDKDLQQLVAEVRGHALTLKLLGHYLKRAHGGDVRRKDRVRLDRANAKVQGDHAFETIEAYDLWLQQQGEAGGRQLAMLYLLGLFDREASVHCLEALRQQPVIEGLTEPLMGLDEEDWNDTASSLEEAGLLAVIRGEGGPSAPPKALDAHPLLREYFADQLRRHSPNTWKSGHSRLFKHLCESNDYRPNTLQGLQPLYQAVAHGCLAGRQQDAFVDVYLGRILRGTGNDGYYSTNKLGAFGADLSAISCFFDKPWTRPSTSLSESNQADLLALTAFRLRALGRLTEALEPMRAGLDAFIELENWLQASKGAGNLSELELTLGQVEAAVQDARQAVVFADRSGDAHQPLLRRTTLADASHQAGRRDEAFAVFAESERIQKKRQPAEGHRFVPRGSKFCDLLLAPAEAEAWRRRAGVGPAAGKGLVTSCQLVLGRAGGRLELEARVEGDSLLESALNFLSLGRATLLQALLEGGDPAAACADLRKAVEALRQAGAVEFIARGLLSRAWLYHLLGDPAAAQTDLNEAQETAAQGPMPLLLADIHLHRARLFHDPAALAEARRLIEKHGYGRRKGELEDAERAAAGWG